MIQARRVILIEDDCDDVEIFQRALSDISFTDVECRCVQKCADIDQLTDFIPDIIFLDLRLPAIEGIECLNMIKEMPAYKGVPVVIYSSSMYQKDIQRCLDIGVKLFFHKPTNYTALINHLQFVLGLTWYTSSSEPSIIMEDGTMQKLA